MREREGHGGCVTLLHNTVCIAFSPSSAPCTSAEWGGRGEDERFGEGAGVNESDLKRCAPC